MKVTKQTLRQINNMKDYCDFDAKAKIATIKLHFNFASELIDCTLSTPERPVISKETIQYLSSLMDMIPKEFSVRYSFVIDDYQGYDSKLLLDVLKRSVERSFYNIDNHEMSSNVLWTLLAVVGLTIMLIRVLGTKYQWYGVSGTLISAILIGFLEIFSEVFFEESVIFFVISESKLDFFKRKFRRFKSFVFKNSSGEILCSIDDYTLSKDWVGVSKLFTYAKNYLLAFSLIALILTATQGVPIIFNFDTTNIGFQISNITCLALAIILLLSNLSYYREKYFLREYAMIISILLCILEIGMLITSLITNIVSTSIIIVTIVTIIGSIINIMALRYVWTCRYES